MNPFSYLYTEFLWRPLFNGMVFLYATIPPHDLGVSIIILTLAVRIILFPLLHKSRIAQKELARIQPEMKRIQNQHKNDKQAQSKALAELYASQNVNPFSGCLLVISSKVNLTLCLKPGVLGFTIFNGICYLLTTVIQKYLFFDLALTGRWLFSKQIADASTSSDHSCRFYP